MFNLLVAQTEEWVQAVRFFPAEGLRGLGDNRAALCRGLVTDVSVPFI
jgi:hypothetical protein